MPRITQIEPQKKKKGRFNIFIDDKFALGAREDTVIGNALKIGKELKGHEIKKIAKKEHFANLQDIAIRFLNWRPRSEKELKDHLAEKIARNDDIKFRQAQQSPVIDQIIAKLKKYKLIDDRQFAKWFIDSRGRSHQKSKRLVALELKRKGIDPSVIETVIKTGYDEKNLAIAAVAKKIERWQKLPEIEFKKKIYAHLMLRGFDFDTIKVVFAYFQKKR